MNAGGKTLQAATSPTVLVLSLLHGRLPAGLSECSALANRMPTTTDGDYTAVPTVPQFSRFRSAHVQLLQELFAAGIRDYTAVSGCNRDDFVAAVHGSAEPRFTVLLEKNGSTLELHTPRGKPSVLAVFPPEHSSHVAWQALAPESRLWVLVGLVTVYAARASLLGTQPPHTEQLLGMIGGAQLKWYKSGAYCEAVMKTVRRLQFRAAYGDAQGELLWAAWYRSCKQRAGATDTKDKAEGELSKWEKGGGSNRGEKAGILEVLHILSRKRASIQMFWTSDSTPRLSGTYGTGSVSGSSDSFNVVLGAKDGQPAVSGKLLQIDQRFYKRKNVETFIFKGYA